MTIKDEKSTDKINGMTNERLNLVLALCAILISAASFYATYLQAESAEKQVKAMTLPLLQFTSGNWNKEKEHSEIILSLKNAGVGPAIIKTVTFKYDNEEFTSITKLYERCCKKEAENYFNKRKEYSTEQLKTFGDSYLTSSLENSIIPGQDKKEFLVLRESTLNSPFWNKLNNERFKMNMTVCYCSLLGECYLTEKSGVTNDIDVCPIKEPKT